jgi:DNA-binding XRE family transcriptional regulator
MTTKQGTKSTAKDELQKEVLRLYEEGLESGEVGFSYIGEKVGLSGTRVKQILIDGGITDPVSTAKRGRKSTVGLLPLSPLHGLIGRRITLNRLDTTQTEYGRLVGMSSAAVSAAESGHYDLTLRNLQSLAAHMGVTLEELMKEVT